MEEERPDDRCQQREDDRRQKAAEHKRVRPQVSVFVIPS